MSTSETALQTDISSARFLAGEDRGRWQLIEIQWPYLFIDLIAKDSRKFTLRLNCTGYRQTPPTGSFWDRATGTWLAQTRWPRGGRINEVLRAEWKNGTALYLPCDREGIAGHDNWHGQYPSLIWKPERGITQYLEIVHELLHCRDYTAAA